MPTSLTRIRFGFEIQALTDFLCSNKIEILNVAGRRESKEPGVYEWTLTMLRFFLIGWFLELDPQKQLESKYSGRARGWGREE
jgi:hypothetical protein